MGNIIPLQVILFKVELEAKTSKRICTPVAPSPLLSRFKLANDELRAKAALRGEIKAATDVNRCSELITV